MELLLGSEIDIISKILIKPSNVVNYIESYIQNINSLIKYDPII